MTMIMHPCTYCPASIGEQQDGDVSCCLTCGQWHYADFEGLPEDDVLPAGVMQITRHEAGQLAYSDDPLRALLDTRPEMSAAA